MLITRDIPTLAATSPPRHQWGCRESHNSDIQNQFLLASEAMGRTFDKSLAAKAYGDRSHQITGHDEPIQMDEAESLCLENRLRFYARGIED